MIVLHFPPAFRENIFYATLHAVLLSFNGDDPPGRKWVLKQAASKFLFVPRLIQAGLSCQSWHCTPVLAKNN